MNTAHVLIFCTSLSIWLWSAKKVRKVEGGKDKDWKDFARYYGGVVSIFLFASWLWFFGNYSPTGIGQINVYTSEGDLKGGHLDAKMIENPKLDQFHYFKKAQYEITQVTWPNGNKDEASCFVSSGSKSKCKVGGQMYYVEIAWFQKD